MLLKLQLSHLSTAFLLFVGQASEAQQSGQLSDFNFWGPIACMKAVDPLDGRYRPHMQIRCFTLPGLICGGSAEPNDCFDAMTKDVEVFVQDARQKLPPEISDDSSYLPRHYLRALERMNSSPTPEPWCMEKPESTEDLCRFLDLVEPTMAAFTAARWAEVNLRSDDRRIYIEPSPSGDSNNDAALSPPQLNPVNCLSAAYAIEWRYPVVMDVECLGIGLDYCANQDDHLACLSSQISRMIDFVQFVRPSFPAAPDLSGFDLSDYQRRLNRFDELLQAADECEGTIPEGVAACRYANYVSLTLSTFEISDMIATDFLVSLRLP